MEETIGNRIEKIIKELNITPKELALSLKTDTSHIKRIITGEHKGSDTLYELICCKYNINHKWLITGQGSIYNDFNLANFSKVLEIYKKLDKSYQDYMFYNLQKLLELQNKNEN